jgi:hypothetical protein
MLVGEENCACDTRVPSLVANATLRPPSNADSHASGVLSATIRRQLRLVSRASAHHPNWVMGEATPSIRPMVNKAWKCRGALPLRRAIEKIDVLLVRAWYTPGEFADGASMRS